MLERLKNLSKAEEIEMHQFDNGFMDSPPETEVEMQSFIVKPQAAQSFPHIHKDFVLSYLYENEIKSIRNMGDLVSLFEFFGMEDAKRLFHHDTFWFLNSARSRKGFERKMNATNISKSEMTQKMQEKKKVFGII